MKKLYSKPRLELERFALTQRLSNCNVLIGSNDNMCIISDENSSSELKDLALAGWFLSDGCLSKWVGEDVIDGGCTFTSVNLMFSS